MTLSKFIALALLAFATGAAAKAATVPAPIAGDIFVGFRVSGGLGGSTSYLVKLGNDSLFTGSLGTTFELNLGDPGQDLESVFGANWFTRDDLYWGIFGHRTSASSILYASKERTNLAEQSVAWSALDVTARNSTDSQITAVLDGIGGYRGRDATANSAFATTQPNTSDASSFFKQVATAGTTDFGSLSQWTSIEGSFGRGADGTVLDLYRIAGSGVTYRGSFAIDDGGTITYSVVPEPASAALLATGALLLGTRRRRAAALV